jgi:uncharacterized protein (DUF3820 family)
MTDAPAAAFEKTPMPFGKYQGEPVGDVPVDYLIWMTEGDFTTTMRRYLASERFQRRQAEAEVST